MYDFSGREIPKRWRGYVSLTELPFRHGEYLSLFLSLSLSLSLSVLRTSQFFDSVEIDAQWLGSKISRDYALASYSSVAQTALITVSFRKDLIYAEGAAVNFA